jgi:hypothetical protein
MMLRRTETDGEEADIDDHERGGAGGAELDDEDDDILGRDMEGGAGGGLGTDEGVHRYQTDTRSYGHLDSVISFEEVEIVSLRSHSCSLQSTQGRLSDQVSLVF